MGESICFIMPTMDGGGAERVVSILSGEFARSGCDVTLFLTNSTHTAYALDKRVPSMSIHPARKATRIPLIRLKLFGRR